jgi:peptidoglycan/LPS O-acetylase OafA/YrhL
VYPVLWVIAIPVLLANVLVQSTHMPNDWPEKASLIGGSLSLVPTPELPLPCSVWTLKHEVLFYLMFVLLLWRPRIGAAVLAVWGALCIYHATRGFKSNFITDFLLSPFNIEFLLGFCCGYIVRVKRVRFPVAISCLGALSLGTACLFYEQIPDQTPWVSNGTSGWQVLQFGLGSALLIVGLSQLDLHHRIVPPKWLLLIGAASYSIYLIHDPAIAISCRALKMTSKYSGITALQAFVVTGLFGVFVGLCFHLSVELPLLKVARQALLPAKNKLLPTGNPIIDTVACDGHPGSVPSPVGGSGLNS